jgi:hypothetical protein
VLAILPALRKHGPCEPALAFASLSLLTKDGHEKVGLEVRETSAE